jgi:hypothetical protein
MDFTEKGRAASLLCLLLASSACTSDGNFRGRLYWGHEVRAFRPCGSQSAYWVKSDEKTLQTLRAQASKPYSPFYMEGVGEIDTKSRREGFARDYEGLLHLREVKRLSDVVPKDCR